MTFNLKTTIEFAIAFACSLVTIDLHADELATEVLARSYTYSEIAEEIAEDLSIEILLNSYRYTEEKE